MIRPIGTSPSFKAIYTSKANFSPEQEEVIDNLIGQLRSDENRDAKGRTLEQQYEYKGKDFLFKPSQKGYDHVFLEFLTGTKPLDENSVRSLPFREEIDRIGDFNKDNVGNLKFAIGAADQREKDEYSGFIHACKLVFGGLAFALACIYGSKCCSHNNKPVQEQVTKTVTMVKDSVAKDLPKDTLNLF